MRAMDDLILVQSAQRNMASYKRVLSTFPTGVCLVVIGADEDAIAVTISSFASISLSPAIVQFALKNNSRFLGLVVEETSYSIYILSEAQRDVASYFGQYPAAKVKRSVLEGAASVIHCKFEAALAKGDHTLIFGEVESFDIKTRRSLVYYQAGFGIVG